MFLSLLSNDTSNNEKIKIKIKVVKKKKKCVSGIKKEFIPKF